MLLVCKTITRYKNWREDEKAFLDRHHDQPLSCDGGCGRGDGDSSIGGVLWEGGEGTMD